MSNEIIGQVGAIAIAIIGLATLAVILSRRSNTAGVIGAGSSGLAKDISAAIAPITGNVGFADLGATGGDIPMPILG